MSRPCETCSNQLPEGCYSNRQFCDDCRQERQRECDRKYQQTPEYKERNRKYEQTPERKEYMHKYEQTPEYKQKKRKHERNRAETLKFCQMIQTMAAWEEGKQQQAVVIK